MSSYYSAHNIDIQLTLVKIHAHEPNQKEWAEYLQFLSQQYSRPFPFMLIHDVSDGKYLNAEQRIQIGKIIKQHEGQLQLNCIGIALVNTSVIANIVLRGIFLVSPLPVKHKIFINQQDAITWSKEQLSAVVV